MSSIALAHKNRLRTPIARLLHDAKVQPAQEPRNLIEDGPLNPDGSLAQPLGKVGGKVSVAQGQLAARLTALVMLGSLRRAFGDLDRISAWSRVFGMVNSAPGFNQQPVVINGFSELILEVFGPAIGSHARSAVGLYELRFDMPVEIEGEVEFTS
ncbi:MAG: RidA family protein [Chitinophagaceae bacterium]|nr:RidA family protein [Rubrivivax sp.]